MTCFNHPGGVAVATCAGCAESFCQNCLVQIHGTNYCASCKGLAVPAAAVAQPTTLSPLAKEALVLSMIGLACFGVILEPVAIGKALKARRQIAADPSLHGTGHTTAALIIAAVGLLGWVVGIVVRVRS